MTPEEIELLRGLKMCNYSGMGALAFLAWDICITIGDETRQIWSRPRSFLKVLYYFLRYHSLGLLLLEQVLVLKLEGGLVFSDRSCYIWLGFQAISAELLQMGIQVLLILRLYALYPSAILHRFLALLFCAEVITMTVLFGLHFNQIRFGEQCAVIHIPVIAIAFFAWPPAFETLLFVLTMAKFYLALRDSRGRDTVMTRFLQDGIWVFVLPFVSSAVNASCMLLLRGPISSVAYEWIIAVAGFTGYRLILNTSHLLRQANYQEGTCFPETMPETFDEETRYRRYRSFIKSNIVQNQEVLTEFSELSTFGM